MSLNLHIKKEVSKANTNAIWMNIEYCRGVFKEKKLGEGFSLRKSDSGSQTMGMIKDAIVYLSWSPPFGTRFSSFSKPLSTLQDPKAFQEEFKNAYNEFKKYADECYKKLKENPQKWSSTPPKGMAKGIGRFKMDRSSLNSISDPNPSGYSAVD